MTIFEPKNYNYRQQKAEKLHEKPNFAESWNTETRKSREKRKLNESWNTEFRETREKPNFAENCNLKPILYLI